MTIGRHKDKHEVIITCKGNLGYLVSFFNEFDYILENCIDCDRKLPKEIRDRLKLDKVLYNYKIK